MHGPGGARQPQRCFLMPAWKALAPFPQRRHPRPRGSPAGHWLPGVVTTAFLLLPRLCPCWESSPFSSLRIFCPLPSPAPERHFLRDLPDQELLRAFRVSAFIKSVLLKPKVPVPPWRSPSLRALCLSWCSPAPWGWSPPPPPPHHPQLGRAGCSLH